jgi:hypothetical protein
MQEERKNNGRKVVEQKFKQKTTGGWEASGFASMLHRLGVWVVLVDKRWRWMLRNEQHDMLFHFLQPPSQPPASYSRLSPTSQWSYISYHIYLILPVILRTFFWVVLLYWTTTSPQTVVVVVVAVGVPASTCLEWLVETKFCTYLVTTKQMFLLSLTLPHLDGSRRCKSKGKTVLSSLRQTLTRQNLNCIGASVSKISLRVDRYEGRRAFPSRWP